jgi:hypothetical protein
VGGKRLRILVAFLLLAAGVTMLPAVFADSEKGGDRCQRKYEERFNTLINGLKVEGWSWRPYGVRCTIYRDDGTTVQIVAHPYW